MLTENKVHIKKNVQVLWVEFPQDSSRPLLAIFMPLMGCSPILLIYKTQLDGTSEMIST